MLRPKIKGASVVFGELLDCIQAIRKDFDETRKESGRIAVVVSVFNEKDVLPKTLMEMGELIKGAGLDGEIFIILNNGGGNTATFLDHSMSLDRKRKLGAGLGVAEIIFGETNRLADTAESTDAVPRKLKLEKEIPKKAEGVKLIVIKQQRESNNGGKIRALRDIYEFLLSQNKKWGYCPQYLLAIDAETRLRRREPRSGRISTEINFGLCHMIELSKAATVFVGAKNQSIAFDPNGNPNWDAQTPPMQKVTSLLHGLDGYQWLPGGATLGGFKDTVSAMSAISRKLPGLWVEDTMLTAVAKALGIKTVIDSEVVHTNRCPGPAERQEISLQMERWLMGTEGVRSLIGVSFARKVINDNLTKAISHLLSESIKGRSVNLAYLLKGVTPYLQAKLRSRRQPNDLIADPASFG